MSYFYADSSELADMDPKFVCLVSRTEKPAEVTALVGTLGRFRTLLG